MKKNDDLLAVRSDAYMLTDDFHIIPNPSRSVDDILVILDADYYKIVADLDARFPYGPPSLLNCSRFEVKGDFKFGRNIFAQGEVHLINESGYQVEIPGNTMLSGVYRYG